MALEFLMRTIYGNINAEPFFSTFFCSKYATVPSLVSDLGVIYHRTLACISISSCYFIHKMALCMVVVSRYITCVHVVLNKNEQKYFGYRFI